MPHNALRSEASAFTPKPAFIFCLSHTSRLRKHHASCLLKRLMVEHNRRRLPAQVSLHQIFKMRALIIIDLSAGDLIRAIHPLVTELALKARARTMLVRIFAIVIRRRNIDRIEPALVRKTAAVIGLDRERREEVRTRLDRMDPPPRPAVHICAKSLTQERARLMQRA